MDSNQQCAGQNIKNTKLTTDDLTHIEKLEGKLGLSLHLLFSNYFLDAFHCASRLKVPALLLIMGHYLN